MMCDRKIVEMKCVSDDYIPALMEKVNKDIPLWQPWGDIIMKSHPQVHSESVLTVYYQPMVRYEDVMDDFVELIGCDVCEKVHIPMYKTYTCITCHDSVKRAIKSVEIDA